MTSLSYSNYTAMRKCGEYYRLNVEEKIPQPKQTHFEFGSALHAGLNTLLEMKDLSAALDVFEAYWATAEGMDFTGERFNHAYLAAMGVGFVSKFDKRLASDMQLIVAEKRMYEDHDLDVKLEGTPDALVTWNGQNVLLDFKSSAYNYDPIKTNVSLQLNLYAYLLEQNGYKVDALAYIVFNKGVGSVQTPHIVKYDKHYALTHIVDMVSYFKRNLGHYEKNPTACIIGKQVCPYFSRCFKES